MKPTDDNIVFNILVKYMAEVLESEGINYIHDTNDKHESKDRFTNEEFKILDDVYIKAKTIVNERRDSFWAKQKHDNN